jgi:hypothetical protein
MRTFIRLGLVAVGIVALTARVVGGDAAGDAAAEIARLKAEIEHLRGRLPDQSHVMKDIGYHFSNLWFAARAKNWPLAKFYLDETRSHLKWAVRVIPVRKTKEGDLDLRVILDALDRTVLADTQKAIDARDPEAFSKAYQQTLNGCYACHTAAEKPYLRPKIPEQPETRIIDFEPSPAGRE